MRAAGTVLLSFLVAAAPDLRAQDLPADAAGRIGAYEQYFDLVTAPLAGPGTADGRLDAALREARQDFGGRGPALAGYFLRHVMGPPRNDAYFFLFRAVGDVATARVLIDALLDPPAPDAGVMTRDPGQVGVALEAVLRNEAVRTDPAVLSGLDGVIVRGRQRPGGDWAARTAIELLALCGTPEATHRLQALAGDPDPAIRTAAVNALGSTGSPAAGATLERTLAADPDPGARAGAAESLGRSPSPSSSAALLAALQQESSPEVVDAGVMALATLRALPDDPRMCLALANKGWDASVVRPLFDCWRGRATRDDLIAQATSASWTVRALALHALTTSAGAAPRSIVTLPLPAGGGSGAPPVFEPAVRDRLLQSLVEVLSRETSGLPAPGTLSYPTLQLGRDALWEIAGRDMSVALPVADRIVPVSGRSTSAGRFGASADLAARNPGDYAARRRPRQLLAAALAALLVATLLAVRPLRTIAVALLASIGMWAVWFSVNGGVNELPPRPLAFFTISALAFLAAGVAAGLVSGIRIRGWMKLAASPAAAGSLALLLCAFTRSASLFPISAEGWSLFFDPIGCALLSAPAALVLSIGLLRWSRE